MCLLISIASWEKCLTLCYYLMGLFVVLLSCRDLYIAELPVSVKYMICYFLPLCGLSFAFLLLSFTPQRFNFDEVQYIYIFVVVVAFGIVQKKALPSPAPKDLLLSLLRMT